VKISAENINGEMKRTGGGWRKAASLFWQWRRGENIWRELSVVSMKKAQLAAVSSMASWQ